jgi:hypothetical protein
VIDFFWEPKNALCFLYNGYAGGLAHMALADDYRRYAAECVALAQGLSDPAEKTALLQMAQAWHELAEKQEARAAADREK